MICKCHRNKGYDQESLTQILSILQKTLGAQLEIIICGSRARKALKSVNFLLLWTWLLKHKFSLLRMLKHNTPDLVLHHSIKNSTHRSNMASFCCPMQGNPASLVWGVYRNTRLKELSDYLASPAGSCPVHCSPVIFICTLAIDPHRQELEHHFQVTTS